MIMKLFKKGDLNRGRSNLPPILTQLKNLRNNYDWKALDTTWAYLMYRKNIQNGGFGREISGDKGNAPRTRGGCQVCKVHLCRKGTCVERFYAIIDTLDYKE